MSKTHKITKLKKRIAELEKKLNRREDPISNPLHLNVYRSNNVVPVVVEHKIRLEEYERLRFSEAKEYQEFLSRVIPCLISDSEVFLNNIKCKVVVPDDPISPVTIKAAIMVAPCQDNILEE